MIEKIVSGGQTGADRAALDWAIRHGISHQGWCPNGRKAEDGPIGGEYRLRETVATAYLVRTEWNVRDSDATVVFTLAPEVTGGSLATLRFARRLGKPVLHLSLASTPDPVSTLVDFVEDHVVRVLNVAGPRASGEPKVGDFVDEVLTRAFIERGAGSA